MSEDSGAWFKWRHFHPREAEDPARAFAAGILVGRQQMLSDSSQWIQLEPLLASLLEELVTLREERAIEHQVVASDTRDQEPCAF